MDSFFWTTGLIGAGLAILTTVALALLSRPRTTNAPGRTTANLSMLFDETHLIDADDPIWPLLPVASGRLCWAEVRRALVAILPDLPDSLTATSRLPTASCPGFEIRKVHGGHRVMLIADSGHHATWFEARRHEAELARMRPAVLHAPDPIWSTGHDGGVIWGNDAFEAVALRHGGADAFARRVSELLDQPTARGSQRLDFGTPGAVQVGHRWLEVTTRQTDTGMIHFATGIDAVVRAEEAQRNFVQTLSKTFANLTTGLAIFDRDRRLALFNPALIDLSGVSAEFLSARPALFEFFDRLREQQVMPEPKNYDDWRERMARLVAAASDDRFRETWNLAGGQTFDVTGRPYPDGAIAFLFNDITAEISLTRGFRTELDTMQSVFDVIEDPIAVFNQQGVLTLCNAAYKGHWNVDPDTCIADATILDATQDWKSAFHPSPVWSELREYVTSCTERASWDCELRSRDGREVICKIDPICFGATLIRFCHVSRPKDGTPETGRLQIVSA